MKRKTVFSFPSHLVKTMKKGMWLSPEGKVLAKSILFELCFVCCYEDVCFAFEIKLEGL